MECRIASFLFSFFLFLSLPFPPVVGEIVAEKAKDYTSSPSPLRFPLDNVIRKRKVDRCAAPFFSFSLLSPLSLKLTRLRNRPNIIARRDFDREA